MFYGDVIFQHDDFSILTDGYDIQEDSTYGYLDYFSLITLPGLFCVRSHYIPNDVMYRPFASKQEEVLVYKFLFTMTDCDYMWMRKKIVCLSVDRVLDDKVVDRVARLLPKPKVDFWFKIKDSVLSEESIQEMIRKEESVSPLYSKLPGDVLGLIKEMI